MHNYIKDYLKEIFNLFSKADNIILFLDYDGTLVSFRDNPSDVKTPNHVLKNIQKLVLNRKLRVVIISGRTLSELKSLLNIDGLSYAALHGIQIELSNGNNFFWKKADEIKPLLMMIKKRVLKEFRDNKDVTIEDKRNTLAFHYRRLSECDIEDAVEKFIEIVRYIDTENSLDLVHGAKVAEIRPKGWNKGKAVKWILNNLRVSGNTIPVYLGDDITDEDAFQYIGKNGVTIYVENNSSRSTSAQYRAKNPEDVLRFLKNI
jgi:trehalose 6-phosphate phosphatase